MITVASLAFFAMVQPPADVAAARTEMQNAETAYRRCMNAQWITCASFAKRWSARLPLPEFQVGEKLRLASQHWEPRLSQRVSTSNPGSQRGSLEA